MNLKKSGEGKWCEYSVDNNDPTVEIKNIILTYGIFIKPSNFISQ